MAIAYFPNLSTADVVELSLVTTDGGTKNVYLLVDTGFIGSSMLSLATDIENLVMSPAMPANTFGAIQGIQPRAIVVCRVPALEYQGAALAILSDLTSLGLPPGVHGMVGLKFLRQFRRWGSEKMDDGSWRFFLET